MNAFKVLLLLLFAVLFGCKSEKENVEDLVYKINGIFQSDIEYSIMIDPKGVDLVGGNAHMIWMQCGLKSSDVYLFLKSLKVNPALRNVERYWKNFGDSGLEWWNGDLGGDQQAGYVVAPKSSPSIGGMHFTLTRISENETMLNICVSSSRKRNSK